ncbi:Rhodanese-like domain-containing protein 4A chloroplastic [Bienertia sinuspersici]
MKLASTTRDDDCSFDGNSIKVAELLVNNGFKEAYAVKGGVSGKSGWRVPSWLLDLRFNRSFFPPSVHVYPKKKKRSQREDNGAANQSDTQVQAATLEK